MEKKIESTALCWFEAEPLSDFLLPPQNLAVVPRPRDYYVGRSPIEVGWEVAKAGGGGGIEGAISLSDGWEFRDGRFSRNVRVFTVYLVAP